MSGMTNKKRKLNTSSNTLPQLYDEIQNLPAEEQRNAMKEKRYRQASFGSNWPHYSSKTLNAATMAQAHLYYTGSGDKATCPYCKVFIEDWDENDDPMEEHREYAKGRCDFLNSQAAGSGSNSKSKNGKKDRRLDSANVGMRARQDRDPNMRVSINRLKSFVGSWNRRNAKLEQELSDAGFYRDENETNQEDDKDRDKVICFSCGLTLREWNNNDDPWIEHAREQPDCAFVKEKKGEFYIDQVIKGKESTDIIRVVKQIAAQQGISKADIDEAVLKGPFESEEVMKNTILNVRHENVAARGVQADDGDHIERSVGNVRDMIHRLELQSQETTVQANGNARNIRALQSNVANLERRGN